MEKNKLRELVEQAKMGNRWSMSTLTEEYKQQVRGVCRSMIADETRADLMAHEAFQTAYDRLSELDNPEDFLPWVTQIAREKCGAMRVTKGTALEKKQEKRLSKAEKKTALAKPDKSGAPAVTMPVEQPKKKSKAAGIIVGAAALLVLVLLAGVVALFVGRKPQPEAVVSEADVPEFTIVSDEDALEEYEEIFEKCFNYNEDKVYFADVTGDGTEELFVIDCSQSEGTKLFIYSYSSKGSPRKLYELEGFDTIESMGMVGMCEYEGKQCIYELQVYGNTPTGGYYESIFCFDNEGNRDVRAYWTDKTHPEAHGIGSYNFNDYRDIRKEGEWAYKFFDLD